MSEGASEREDLAELRARRALTEDAARPEAVARRHDAGARTARENIDDLVDPGTLSSTGATRSPPSAGGARSRS